MEAIRDHLTGGWRAVIVSAAIAIAAALLHRALSSRAPAAPSGDAQASGAKTVDIVSFAFHPGTLRVRRGAKVVFSNTAAIAHTASGRRGAFEAGVIRPGHSAAVRFRRRGVFSYFCRIHPFMHGKIVVR
ncbi:MAG TPA: plastocyanin/azurin family copper-binding protein [Solirubrobacterales bacterium]